MRSYASIDRIESGYAICEIELVEEEISRLFEYGEKETIMVDVPLDLIEHCVGKVEESDVLVVECVDGQVDYVYCKDNDEKRRRINELRSFLDDNNDE